MSKLPNWAFYPGQQPPQVGDVFLVKNIESGVYHLDAGRFVTTVELERVEVPAAPGVPVEVWEAIKTIGNYAHRSLDGEVYPNRKAMRSIDIVLAWLARLEQEGVGDE